MARMAPPVLHAFDENHSMLSAIPKSYNLGTNGIQNSLIRSEGTVRSDKGRNARAWIEPPSGMRKERHHLARNGSRDRRVSRPDLADRARYRDALGRPALQHRFVSRD